VVFPINCLIWSIWLLIKLSRNIKYKMTKLRYVMPKRNITHYLVQSVIINTNYIHYFFPLYSFLYISILVYRLGTHFAWSIQNSILQGKHLVCLFIDTQTPAHALSVSFSLLHTHTHTRTGTLLPHTISLTHSYSLFHTHNLLSCLFGRWNHLLRGQTQNGHYSFKRYFTICRRIGVH